MFHITPHPYCQRVKQGIESLCPGAWKDPEKLHSLDAAAGHKLLQFILSFGECHDPLNHKICHTALLALPRSWLLDHILPVVAESIDSDDDWKLRPLVRAMAHVDVEFARAIADRCADSENWRVREVTKLIEKFPSFARKGETLRRQVINREPR